jgi:hypothetical protein
MQAIDTEVTSFQTLISTKCQLKRHRYIVSEPVGMHVNNVAMAKSRSIAHESRGCPGQSGALPTAIQAKVQ